MTGNSSKTVRIIEIAELLGVSKQRAHQLADEPGFPAPVERDGRGRLWSRREVMRGRGIGEQRSRGARARPRAILDATTGWEFARRASSEEVVDEAVPE